jgi:hypothetical protein
MAEVLFTVGYKKFLELVLVVTYKYVGIDV